MVNLSPRFILISCGCPSGYLSLISAASKSEMYEPMPRECLLFQVAVTVQSMAYIKTTIVVNGPVTTVWQTYFRAKCNPNHPSQKPIQWFD